MIIPDARWYDNTEQEMQHLSRPKPARTRPIRSAYHHLLRVSSTNAGGGTMMSNSSRDACGTPEPGQPIGGGPGSETGSISDLIKQAVDQGYQVIDQYIAEGRNAASLIRDGSYNQEQAELDIRNLLNHWVVLAKQLSVTGIELVSAIVSDSRLVPPPK